METEKFYGFYSYGSKKLNGTLISAMYLSAENMQFFSLGIVEGLQAYCSTAEVYVYEIEEIADCPEGAHPYRLIDLVRILR